MLMDSRHFIPLLAGIASLAAPFVGGSGPVLLSLTTESALVAVDSGDVAAPGTAEASCLVFIHEWDRFAVVPDTLRVSMAPGRRQLVELQIPVAPSDLPLLI